MARLIRGLLVFVALVTLCVGASAEPVTTFLASTAFTTAAGAAISYGAVISAVVTAVSVVSSVYGSMQAKKQARQAIERKVQQDLANLRERTTTIVAADDAWPVIYGEPAPVGGSVKAVMLSGERDQYKHIVLVLASHECDDVTDVLIDGESLQLDSYGTSHHPAYQLEYGVVQEATFPFTVGEYLNVLTGEMVSAATVDTGALGQLYNAPQILEIKDADGNPISGMTIGNPMGIRAPNTGFVLLGGTPGLTGTVKLRIEGAGSAVHVSKHLSRGGVDFADPILRGAVPSLWTEDHKLSGYTYLVITINLLLERFQGGMPSFTARVRGKRCYDPRTGTTYYTRNPAICLADFLQSEAGYLALPEQIDQNALIAAANACDQVVYGEGAWGDSVNYGNDTRLYTCDGMFRTDQDRDTTRQQIEDSMAGYSLESGGVWRILAGAWSTPVMALTDADLLAPPVVVQTCNPGTARYNGARGSYVNKARNGVTEDFTPYQNAVFREADAKDKMLDVALSFTSSHVRAQQIARTLVEQSRGGFILAINPKMTAWHLQPGDRFVFSSDDLAISNKNFRIQDWAYSQTSPLAFQVIEDEPSFYDLADEVQADPAPNTNLTSPFLKPGAPLDLAVTSGANEVVVQGGSAVVRAHVTWAQSDSAAVRMGGWVRLQWRTVTPVGEWVTIDLPGDAVETYILGLNVSSEYQVRVRFQTAYTFSDWSTVSHTLRGISEIPSDVQGLTATLEADGTIARWSSPQGAEATDWAFTQIRVGATWETAEVRFTGKALMANIGWLPAGTVKVWAAHANTQGVFGVAISTTIDIEPPAQPIVQGEAWPPNIELRWQDCRTDQPISSYLIKVGPTLDAAVQIGQTQALNFVRGEPPGTRLYWVQAFDAGGNAGDAGYVEVQSLAPIDVALEELQAGLDQTVADLLNVGSGISERLVDEVFERGTEIARVETLVTEGDEQLAQQIETVAARAVGYVRANLIKNGGFEFDLDNWTMSSAGWAIVEDSWGTSARLSSSVPASGWLSSPKFPVHPGDMFTGSGDAECLGSGNYGLSIEYFDAGGNSLGSAANLLPGPHDFENTQDRRNDLSLEALAPPLAAEGAVVFRWNGFSGTELGIRYVKAEHGGLPSTPYTSESSDRGAVAAVRQETLARASAIEAEATARLTLAATVNGNTAAISQEATVRATQTGQLFARWGVRMDVSGKISGFILNNNGSQSDAVFLVDRFAVATQAAGTTKYPFVVGSVAGAATVGIDGNLVVDGSIQARSIFVDRLSALVARLGYVTAGQIDINGDGAGGWGWIRSPGKWRDDNWGWALAQHPTGDMFVDFNLNGCGLVMHHQPGVSANFHLFGPGFDLTQSGLTIDQINVIDTLQIRGQAVTIPSFNASPGNTCDLLHFTPGTAPLDTFILGSVFVAQLALVTIIVDGNQEWVGGGVAGTTVTGGIQRALAPGWHSIRITTAASAGSGGSSLYALSTRR
ncbi:hypothetical protein H4CHR_02986 [Variovorax sp. PBS-H4]|uniref:phage tail tip fiber protein n=1 Tax=Variovorax sp. PBS-H4 TaxID=434008 RepID=UPI001318E897|nr:DUF1983 domain-containing protein [Variovorax sp. PBS-H4]VTU32310.1 hypothetical protein H4CHR_02986 [Variovorax sp. PBS-H4]